MKKYKREIQIEIMKLSSQARQAMRGIHLKKKSKNGKIKKKRNRTKLAKIPRSYKIYIKSVFWEKRKNDWYRKYGKSCKACLHTKYINLHHMFYKNYGNESDDHLVALCLDCHAEFHELYGVKKDMVKETNEFIINKREVLDFPKI